MPIYEYLCPNCSHEMEAFQSISEPALTQCPQCGKDTLKKKISAAGFQLKGTGWYATDFKDKKPTNTGTSTPSTDKPADTSQTTETKKDTKESKE